LELGKQQAAQVELHALSESSGLVMNDTSLALREPHIEKALAEIDKAQAAVDQAALALARTQITTPFAGLLTERLVNLGDWVSAGCVLATVVNASTFWVEVDIPIEQLHWLTIPVKGSEKGSRATIYVNDQAIENKASVYRLTGSVDSRSRMAKLLIAIDDPLNRQGESNARSIFLGDHVKVVIHGKTLESVSRVPYAWVQEGEKLWIAQDDVLNIRPIRPLYRDSEAVYIGEEVNVGDQIIVSDIVVPVVGMQLNVMRDSANDAR
jgi:multidrug efflux pump subunit AcrA (membrane-fusion protein)